MPSLCGTSLVLPPQDAGYGGKSLLFMEDEDDEDIAQKLDDEVLAAPWNTTKHFINAMKGRYMLQINGPADPTGSGEGFSYIRMSSKAPLGKVLYWGRGSSVSLQVTSPCDQVY